MPHGFQAPWETLRRNLAEPAQSTQQVPSEAAEMLRLKSLP